MGFFKRKDKVIDLGERYRQQQEKLKAAEVQDTKSTEEPVTPFAFFDSQSSQATKTQPESSDVLDLSEGIGKRRQKLAKRILDMTGKMEDLSNQIYHLQQRIELLERKLDVSRFE